MSTCGVIPAVTLHCMGEQEATAVASVAGSWQHSDLQRGSNSVPSVLRCVNAQSDSLVPSPGMTSQASSAKGPLMTADQPSATTDLFTSSSASQQRLSPDSQLQSQDSQLQSQNSQLQSQGKSGWSSVVVLGSGLSVTAMAGAHMAAYRSPTSLLDLLSSLGFSVDIRVLEASAFSLWHVPDGADHQMSLLIFFLMTALCAAAAATLKLSPLPSAPRSSISHSESEQGSTADASSVTGPEFAGDRDGQGGAKVEATTASSSSGVGRSSAWFSFSFSSNSLTPPPAAITPPPCTPPHVVPEAVVARSATAPSTSSTSSSGGGGFFPSSISLPGYWFPFSSSSTSSASPSPSPAQSDSSTESAAESTACSEESVTSLPTLVAASPLLLAAPAPSLAVSSAPVSAFLRLDSEDDLSDMSCDDEEQAEEEEEVVQELGEEGHAGDEMKGGLPLSRSLPSSLCLTLPRSMSMNMSMNIPSSISMGLSSASSSAWSNVASWSQSIMKSPVSLSLGDSPAVLVRSLSQLFSSASRSMAALPTVFSESSIEEMSPVSDPSPLRLIHSDPAELRDRAKDLSHPVDPSLSLVRAADSRAVQAELREAAALVGTRDLAALMLQLDWSYDDEQGPWEAIIDKHSSNVEYMTWRRDPQDGGVTEYRSRIRFIGATARDTCAFYTDCAYMPRWDPMLRSMDPLLACPHTGVQSARFERKYPFCAPREYVLAWRVWQQGGSGKTAGLQGSTGAEGDEGETYFCITKAVEDASVPRKNKPRRVDVYRSEWRMRDVVLPDGRVAAEMDMVVQEDSGMQRDMAKLAYRRGAWGYIRSTDSHLRTYMKKCIPAHRAGEQGRRALVEKAVAAASAPRVLPPLSVVKQVPSHLIPEGAPDAAFHAHCRQTATTPPSFTMAAAAAAAVAAVDAHKLHASGTAALLHTSPGNDKPAAERAAFEGVAGQSQWPQQQQRRQRRFRPLAAVKHLLMPAATVAVGLGGGLLVLNGGAVGVASHVLLLALVVRRSPSTIELTPRQQL
ncbi:hypothetical protein CLOP_g12881 [Closterium sp. NIES-67]|nr:hypothetical protein CLOP_g12881 [Closterium sp. NIES-67]